MPNYSPKSAEAIAAMRAGGKILGRILFAISHLVKPGITTKTLDRAAESMMAKLNVASNFKGYHGFPAVLCTNVNEQIVHAIPSNRTLNDGDIISIDGGIIYQGYHLDAAVTVGVGKISMEARRFIQTAYDALDAAVAKTAKPGMRTGDIGFTIQTLVEKRGYSVIHDFIGHGIGKSLHEPPEIPNFGKSGKGSLLIPNMTICIEPIIAMGKRYCDILSDGWTAITRDGSWAAQVEHSILITETGHEILTLYRE